MTMGVEVCRPAAQYGIEQRGCDIRVGTLSDASFPDGSIDVVHSSHVIEHLTDPIAFVDEIWRILKPGGYIFVATPNAAGLQAKLFGARWRSAIADHMVLFSKRTLGRLLSEHHFAIERIKTWGGLGVGTAPLWLKGPVDRLAKRVGFGDVMIMRGRKIAEHANQKS
jgi:SAM-dependent methyltransferase